MSPAASHRSRCLVWANLVSPRSRMLRKKPARRHKRDGLIQEASARSCEGRLAAPIEQEQRLGGIGQRDQQRMVAVLPVVGEVHPPFALPVAGHDAAIGLQDGFLEELGGLLGPDPQPRFIDGVHQGEDVGPGVAAAEVAGGGRVGDSSRPEGIEEGVVVAAQLEDVPCDGRRRGDSARSVRDMVGFVVGQMAR